MLPLRFDSNGKVEMGIKEVSGLSPYKNIALQRCNIK